MKAAMSRPCLLSMTAGSRDEALRLARTPVEERLAARRVRALHGHECPRAVAPPIAGGDANFLAWIAAEAGGERRAEP